MLNKYTAHAELWVILVIAVSPLIRLTIENGALSRNTWIWIGLISCILIGFFSLNQYRVRLKNIRIAYIFFFLCIASSMIGMLPQKSITALFYTIAISTLIAVYVIKKNKKIVIHTLLTFLCCMSLYAQWGIAQFIAQQDLGLRKIGESHLRTAETGIASFYTSNNTKVIRAYGPFGHSNSLGGVLALGCIIIAHVIIRSNKKAWDRNAYIFMYSIVLTLTVGMLVSFSRTALLASAMPLIIILIRLQKRTTIFLITIPLLVFSPLLFTRSVDPHSIAAQDRLQGLYWAINMATSESFLRGYGIGNYETALAQYLSSHAIAHASWDIAPIHSIPILLFFELGALLSICIFYIGIFALRNTSPIILCILPPLLFDHYFYTQLGPLVWLVSCVIILHRVYYRA